MGNFFKNAFQDMKENAKAQHEVDKANLAAVKAESKAQWEEAKMSPKARQELMQKERDEQIAAAKERTAAAQERIDNAKKQK
ncbi:MAG: hypothetical protein IJW55_07210 [Clostridia bacterium]|nr:hypothetical protein [Clostridia bacterium]